MTALTSTGARSGPNIWQLSVQLLVIPIESPLLVAAHVADVGLFVGADSAVTVKEEVGIGESVAVR